MNRRLFAAFLLSPLAVLADKSRLGDSSAPHNPPPAILPQEPPATDETRKLLMFAWDDDREWLHWIVGVGQMDGDSFREVRREKYEIDMHAATMAVNGEKRAFAEEEAKQVGRVIELVSEYCRQSTSWWLAGKGTPLNRQKL